MRADGTAVGWGSNHFGRTSVPPDITGRAVAVAAGCMHSFLGPRRGRQGPRVGYERGRVGRTDVPDGRLAGRWRKVEANDAGAYFSAAVREDGSVAAWGEDKGGRLDVPDELR
uniref:Uncharacterized protein n=1 Tax=Trieres chinensis TaxID=1514140 RepID=A0A7S1ZYC5_TRICV